MDNPQRTMHSLPPNFKEIYFLRVTEGRRILILNLAAIPLIFATMGVFWGLLGVYHGLGAPLVIGGLPEKVPTLPAVAAVLLVLPLHELVHGATIQYFGHQAKYGIKPLKGVLYATADGAYFWRDQYLVMLLAPLVVISILCTLVSLFLPFIWGFWVMVAAVMNATGAVGDLWMAAAARRFPRGVLICDEKDGMRVFAHP
jgi:hypothetical protein